MNAYLMGYMNKDASTAFSRYLDSRGLSGDALREWLDPEVGGRGKGQFLTNRRGSNNFPLPDKYIEDRIGDHPAVARVLGTRLAETNAPGLSLEERLMRRSLLQTDGDYNMALLPSRTRYDRKEDMRAASRDPRVVEDVSKGLKRAGTYNFMDSSGWQKVGPIRAEQMLKGKSLLQTMSPSTPTDFYNPASLLDQHRRMGSSRFSLLQQYRKYISDAKAPGGTHRGDILPYSKWTGWNSRSKALASFVARLKKAKGLKR